MPNPRSLDNDLTGRTYGRWSVIDRNFDSNYKESAWNCVCSCGQKRVVSSSNLKSGKSVSCGCYRKQWMTESQQTHKLSRTPIYAVWLNMKSRCYYTKNRCYKDYGGRGITVCDRWVNSFENFLSDVGLPPTPKHTLERIRNDDNYEPGNVRWATMKEQTRNRRSNVILTYNGVSKTATDWAIEYGLLPDVVLYRIRVGWPVEKALTTPSMTKRRGS